MNYSEVLTAANQLSMDDRLRLVQEVWDTIADSTEDLPLLSDEQKQELDRRLAEMEAHPERGIPWEEVKARLFDGDDDR